MNFSLIYGFKCNFLLLCGDAELNSGPKKNIVKKVSICHWKLNSVAAYNFAKLILLKAYKSIHKFDIICLSETYLHSNILPDNSIWKFQYIIYYVLIIRQVKNVEVFYILLELFAFKNNRYQLFKRVCEV